MAPEQAFGGDDDSSSAQPQPKSKKLDLSKYASRPDANVRDIFWQVMESYNSKRQITHDELAALQQHEIALIRIAVSELESDRKSYHGLGKNLIATYICMLSLDAGWEGIFEQFVVDSYEIRNSANKYASFAFNRLCQGDKYRILLETHFSRMMRDYKSMHAVLAYIATMKNASLISKLKRELVIIAKNDIETNQYNAMLSLAELAGNGDQEAKSVIISLLSHWDEETKKLAISILKSMKDDAVIEAAKRQAAIEINPEIKKQLDVFISGKAKPEKVQKEEKKTEEKPKRLLPKAKAKAKKEAEKDTPANVRDHSDALTALKKLRASWERLKEKGSK